MKHNPNFFDLTNMSQDELDAYEEYWNQKIEEEQ